MELDRVVQVVLTGNGGVLTGRLRAWVPGSYVRVLIEANPDDFGSNRPPGDYAVPWHQVCVLVTLVKN